VELVPDRGEIHVRTHEPGAFYGGLPAVVLAAGVAVHELASADDNLEAVFNYLIAVD
jgi:hypothetical protein